MTSLPKRFELVGDKHTIQTSPSGAATSAVLSVKCLLNARLEFLVATSYVQTNADDALEEVIQFRAHISSHVGVVSGDCKCRAFRCSLPMI